MASGKASPEAVESPDAVADAAEIDRFEIQSEVFRLWDEAEDDEPTDPYSVLRVSPEATAKEVQAIFDQRSEQYGPDEHGAGCALLSRLTRAANLLVDANRKTAYDANRAEQCKKTTWMMLQYPNGRYEGTVCELPSSTVLKRHGRGISVLAGTEKYEGNYREDSRHGMGLQIWRSGDVYLGQWKGDLMHGLGIFYYGSGPVYDGSFAEGNREGPGRLRWRSGSSFLGQFRGDVRCGDGVELLMGRKSVRARYSGEWRDNRKHGRGLYEAEGGLRYEGDFADDAFHGLGHWKLPNGDQYNGPFLFGQPHSPHSASIYRWGGTGDSYEGEVRRGRLHGIGDYLAAGVTYNGDWERDVPHGTGKLTVSAEDGDGAYDGQWHNGQKDGEGTYHWLNSGCKFIGQFSKDMRHGQGRLEWPDQAHWTGHLAEDVRHGESRYQGTYPSAETKDKWHFGVLCERDGGAVKTVRPEINDAVVKPEVKAQAHAEHKRRQNERRAIVRDSVEDTTALPADI